MRAIDSLHQVASLEAGGCLDPRQLFAVSRIRLKRFRAATAGKGSDPPAQKLHAFHMNHIAAKRGH
jgi:hypothetical protein